LTSSRSNAKEPRIALLISLSLFAHDLPTVFFWGGKKTLKICEADIERQQSGHFLVLKNEKSLEIDWKSFDDSTEFNSLADDFLDAFAENVTANGRKGFREQHFKANPTL
jgi:hypothetical protein